jgi:hypothetical protein
MESPGERKKEGRKSRFFRQLAQHSGRDVLFETDVF